MSGDKGHIRLTTTDGVSVEGDYDNEVAEAAVANIGRQARAYGIEAWDVLLYAQKVEPGGTYSAAPLIDPAALGPSGADADCYIAGLLVRVNTLDPAEAARKASEAFVADLHDLVAEGGFRTAHLQISVKPAHDFTDEG